MWVRTVVNPGAATIKRMAMAPVAVDTNVRRVTLNLGVVAKTRESAQGTCDSIRVARRRDCRECCRPVGNLRYVRGDRPGAVVLWQVRVQSLRGNRESGTDRLSVPSLPLEAITRTRIPGLEGQSQCEVIPYRVICLRNYSRAEETVLPLRYGVHPGSDSRDHTTKHMPDFGGLRATLGAIFCHLNESNASTSSGTYEGESWESC